MIVLIDNEEIFCEAVSGDRCTQAKRGYGDTSATTHSAGTPWVGSVHVQYHATLIPSSNKISIDYLNLNYYPDLDYTNNDNNNVFSGFSVSVATLPSGYPDRVFNQQQMDVAYGIGSTSSPAQIGEYVDEDNVTISWGILGRSSYVVP